MGHIARYGFILLCAISPFVSTLFAAPFNSYGRFSPSLAGHNGFALSGLGTGVQYSEVRAGNDRYRLYIAPVEMPFELALGRLYFGSSIDYMAFEGREAGQSKTSQGFNRFNLNTHMAAYQSRQLRMVVGGSVQMPLTKEQNLTTPGQFMSSNYRLYSEAALQYFMDHTSLELVVGHLWNFERDGIKPGDIYNAAISYGVGFGNYYDYRWPVELTFGIGGRYVRSDRRDGKFLPETEYKTIYASPGVELSGKKMRFHANVELPIPTAQRDRDENFNNNSKNMEDKIRANIGLKWILP